LADSILKTARMARWVSVAVTATDHTISTFPAQQHQPCRHARRAV
jgi:hypothetical protein